MPCREGLDRMLEILNRICSGRGRENDIPALKEICLTMSEASLCGLGKTAPNPVMTTLEHFKDEYLQHIIYKRCASGVCRELVQFGIDSTLCRSCGLCSRNCSSGAIQGNNDKSYFIDNGKCTKCGNCIDVCRFNAVKAL
jgi:NADH-quinone oxidoreductase subunit F